MIVEQGVCDEIDLNELMGEVNRERDWSEQDWSEEECKGREKDAQ